MPLKNVYLDEDMFIIVIFVFLSVTNDFVMTTLHNLRVLSQKTYKFMLVLYKDKIKDNKNTTVLC